METRTNCCKFFNIHGPHVQALILIFFLWGIVLVRLLITSEYLFQLYFLTQKTTTSFIEVRDYVKQTKDIVVYLYDSKKNVLLTLELIKFNLLNYSTGKSRTSSGRRNGRTEISFAEKCISSIHFTNMDAMVHFQAFPPVHL